MDGICASLDLLIDGEQGIWYLANQGALSWFAFAERFVHMAGRNPAILNGVPLQQMSLAAARPQYSVLGSERGLLLPYLDDALFRFVQAIGPQIHRLSVSFTQAVPSQLE